MSKFLDLIRLKRAQLAEERAALLAEADGFVENRDEFGDEQAARGDAIIARLGEIATEDAEAAAREAELADAHERSVNAAKSPVFHKRLDDPTDVVDASRLSDTDARGRALTMVEESRSFVSDDHRENLTHLIETRGSVGAAAARMALTTGTDVYERAWSKYMNGNTFALTEPERAALAKGYDAHSDEERANMTSGTGSTGGYLVPVYIDPTMIITGAGSLNPVRDIATVKTIGPAFGGWYGATAAQVTAAWTAEGSAAPDNGPTITQPNIPVHMAEAFVGVSFQAFEDISDLAGDILALFTDAKANLEAAAHQTGTGSSQPTGISYAIGAVTASRVSPATGGAIALADVFTVHSAIPARFQHGRNTWLAALGISDKIRQLAYAQNSANSVWTDIAAGNPAQLLGEPIKIGSSMSSSQTTGQDVLLYGDFSRYYVVDRIGFTTEFIPNLFDTSTGRPIASRGWLSHWRTGANTVDANAFRQLRL